MKRSNPAFERLDVASLYTGLRTGLGGIFGSVLRSVLGRIGRSPSGLGLRQAGLRGCRQFVNAARQGGERIAERLGLRVGSRNAAGKSRVGARWALQGLLDPIEPA